MLVNRSFYMTWSLILSNCGDHHHHLFLKSPFLLRSARVRRFSRYEVSPHIPKHYPFRVQTQLIHIILHTFSPSLPIPACTSHPCHHHISTDRHPIISTLTFQMPKPPQSTMPHHLNHGLNPKRLYKSTLCFLSFCDTWHIHLTIIRSVLSRLCRIATFITQVSVPCVNTLWTQALYIFPFMRYDAPRAVRIGDNSLNLAQAHLTLALSTSSAPLSAPSVSPK